MTEQCNRCRFWREDVSERDFNDPDWGFGLCRHDPPRVSETYVAALMPKLQYGQQHDPEIGTVSMTTASLFPATGATDWCGRFEANPRVSSGHVEWLAERNRLIERLDEEDVEEDEADAGADRLNLLDLQIMTSPATTKDDAIAKLVLLAQTSIEGHDVDDATTTRMLRDVVPVIGMRHVSPRVANPSVIG